MHTETLLDYVLRRLDQSRGRHKDIAAASGVPYSTLTKIHQRVTPNPGVLHVQRLADYFRSLEAGATEGQSEGVAPAPSPADHGYPQPVHDDRRGFERRGGDRRVRGEQRRVERRRAVDRRDGEV